MIRLLSERSALLEPTIIDDSHARLGRVAIVHSWLNQYGGAERVLEHLHGLFPDAPVYTSMFEPRAFPAFYRTWDIRTSFLQRVPMSRSKHQLMLFLYPLAFEAFDLSGYDLVISLTSGFSHGVRVTPNRSHVSYCLTPPRFLWTFDDYVRLEGVGRATRSALALSVPVLKRWDYRVSQRVGSHVAISRLVQERIKQSYGRQSDVIYPSIGPVDSLPPSDDVDDYFLSVSRLIPYKRVDLAIAACNRLKLPLKVVGSGRSEDALRKLAGPTIEFVGKVDESTLRRLYARCRAFIFPAEEDFGLTPIEAMAAGRPVIAFGRGGTRETVLDGITGTFFPEQSVDSLGETLARFDHRAYDPHRIRDHARSRFDISVFRRHFLEYLENRGTLTAEAPRDAEIRIPKSSLRGPPRPSAPPR